MAAYPGLVFTYNATPQLKDATIPIVIKQNKNKHPMITTSCNGKCKRQGAMFSSEWRQEIWVKYWNQNFVKRRSFLNKCINISTIKRRKIQMTNSNETFLKNESHFLC